MRRLNVRGAFLGFRSGAVASRHKTKLSFALCRCIHAECFAAARPRPSCRRPTRLLPLPPLTLPLPPPPILLLLPALPPMRPPLRHRLQSRKARIADPTGPGGLPHARSSGPCVLKLSRRRIPCSSAFAMSEAPSRISVGSAVSMANTSSRWLTSIPVSSRSSARRMPAKMKFSPTGFPTTRPHPLVILQGADQVGFALVDASAHPARGCGGRDLQDVGVFRAPAASQRGCRAQRRHAHIRPLHRRLGDRRSISAIPARWPSGAACWPSTVRANLRSARRR